MEHPSDACLAEALAVTRSYENGRVKALRGVDLRIEAGDFVAITGSSGSGKTTLLQMLGGLDTPDSGEIRFRGQSLSEMGDLSSFRAQRVGFVFQSFHLLSTLSACENVQVPMVGSPLPEKGREQRAIQLLEQVGLAERIRHRPSELSGGERQRVAIARSLANEPDLLLADEPTGNLDRESTTMVMELLSRIHRDNGTTLVVVTHDPSTAAYARRRITMSDGMVKSDVQASTPDAP
jgi:ABC-type lipoprotein export system ATPase subunit